LKSRNSRRSLEDLDLSKKAAGVTMSKKMNRSLFYATCGFGMG
jgi:hypothetical protein